MDDTPITETEPARLTPIVVRSGIGGVLMGLANLVPGISGGTMLLAVGIYPRFIHAIGEVTTFQFRKASLVTLTSVIAAAVVVVVTLAGPVKNLVVDHRWVMYAIFIGLTLGGVPVIWRLIGKRRTTGMWVGAAAGFVGMAVLAYFQMQGGASANRESWLFLLLAGIAGASAMILPGVSGGYLLLILGVYVPILAGIDHFKEALQAGDTAGVLHIGWTVIFPVGLGVVIGVVAVSNLLKWLLDRYQKPTQGVLLGFLLGAVMGLWPFQAGVAPEVGTIFKGQTVAVDREGGLIQSKTGRAIEPEDYPTAFFSPTTAQITSATAMILAGFGVTLLVDRFGNEKQKTKQPQMDADQRGC